MSCRISLGLGGGEKENKGQEDNNGYAKCPYVHYKDYHRTRGDVRAFLLHTHTPFEGQEEKRVNSK